MASSAGRELDPLLKDLCEKKQSFQRNVVALAAELKDVRIRFASQQESCARETLTRQTLARKARSMEGEIFRLHQSLQEKDDQLQASASTTKQLSGTQETVNASSASAQSAHLQYLALAKGLDEKNIMLKVQEDCMNRLAEQLNHLQMDLQAREVSQKQLKDEILRIEKDIMQEVAVAGASKDCELRKILDDVSPKKIEKISKLLIMKEEEITKLRDEIRVLSAHWKLKAKELESQLDKHQRADQELKKRVLKLEFCLQEGLEREGTRCGKKFKNSWQQSSKEERTVSTNKIPVRALLSRWWFQC